METRFIDGLGRTISRDPKILDSLLTNYKSSNHPVFAQAGKEIEALNTAISRLNVEMDFLRAENHELKKKKVELPKTPRLNHPLLKSKE